MDLKKRKKEKSSREGKHLVCSKGMLWRMMENQNLDLCLLVALGVTCGGESHLSIISTQKSPMVSTEWEIRHNFVFEDQAALNTLQQMCASEL